MHFCVVSWLLSHNSFILLMKIASPSSHLKERMSICIKCVNVKILNFKFYTFLRDSKIVKDNTSFSNKCLVGTCFTFFLFVFFLKYLFE